MSITYEEYQRESGATAVYPGAGDQGSVMGLAYVSMGLAGEAGEILNKVKKILRDDDGEITMAKRIEIRKELGDVMWYAAQLATHLGESLADVSLENLNKLLDRKERGVLQGSGDNR